MQNLTTLPKIQALQIQWVTPGRREMAIQQYRKMDLAERQGLDRQAAMIRQKINHLVLLNQAEQDVSAARKLGLNAKPFAIVKDATPGSCYTIMGPDWYWNLQPLNIYASTIPPRALKAAAFARQAGFDGGCWVASPVPHPKPKSASFPLTKAVVGTATAILSIFTTADPVLVVARQSVLIELDRWV